MSSKTLLMAVGAVVQIDWVQQNTQTSAAIAVAIARGSGGKNVIFSNCPYDQSKYSDPLIYISI
jgi:hypothetical protein